MTEISPIWLRRPDESAKAYHAFGLYRDQSPVSRSLDEAYRLYAEVQDSNKRATGFFTAWSTEFDWVRRAEAYDAERERVRLADKGTEEIEQYRERTRRLAAATTAVAVQLLTRLNERIQTLTAAEITPQMIPAYCRAVAAVAESSTNAEAAANGASAIMVYLEAQR